MALSKPQQRAIREGSPTAWLGCRETGIAGDTMAALERRGLAEVTQENGRGRCLYRLTAAGNALRVEWAIAVATAPVEHTPIRTRCTHCGAEAPDGTPGGACGECGLTVEAVA